jgi:hypothetical protein
MRLDHRDPRARPVASSQHDCRWDNGKREVLVRAYVLIQTQAQGGSLAEQLRAIPGIVAAEDLAGPYDAIALALAGSSRHLVEDVVAEIRRLPGVTLALPAPLINSATAEPRAATSGQRTLSPSQAA